MPGRGYVAVGIVEEPAMKVDAFTVPLPDGRRVPLGSPEVGIQARGMFEHQDDPDKAEYLVRMRWVKDFPLQEAIWEPDFFAIQHSICRPKTASWGRTVSRLQELWGVE